MDNERITKLSLECKKLVDAIGECLHNKNMDVVTVALALTVSNVMHSPSKFEQNRNYKKFVSVIQICIGVDENLNNMQ